MLRVTYKNSIFFSKMTKKPPTTPNSLISWFPKVIQAAISILLCCNALSQLSVNTLPVLLAVDHKMDFYMWSKGRNVITYIAYIT